MSVSRALLDQVKQIIPPLSGKLHKGQAGRVGIVGGSADYTGAPFFAAISALRVGADLSHVICEPDAGSVIKTYSPDLIVHRIITPETTPDKIKGELESLFQRLHVLVIGPGLGRNEHTQSIGKLALQLARQQEKYVVIDADGLYLVQNEPDAVKGYKRAVLTPNVVEFKRLCETMQIPKDAPQDKLASLLSEALGNVTILQKGSSDIISNGPRTESIDIQGGLKRVGGQGDILSGVVGTFLAWGKAYEERDRPPSENAISARDIPLLAAVGGSHITRTTSRIAFSRLGRGVLTSDMIQHVGEAYEELFGKTGEKGFKGSL